MTGGTQGEPNDGRLSRFQVRQLLTDILEDLRPAEEQARNLRTESETRLRAALNSRRDFRIHERLQATSVEQLVDGTGIPLEAVQEMKSRGISSASDVRARTDEDLYSISYLKTARVRALRDKINGLVEPQQEDFQLQSSASLWDGADDAVARALTFWHRVLLGISSSTSQALIGLVSDLAHARRRTAWYRWPLLSQAKKHDIMQGSKQSARNAVRFLQSAEFRRLTSSMADLEHHRGVPVDPIYWKKYSTEIQTDLEKFQMRDSTSRRLWADLPLSVGPYGLDRDLYNQMLNLDLNLQLVRRGLRNYQEDGARFAICVERGLLGDDMGLGKTTQALAAIAHAVSVESADRHIVACPPSLLGTWEDEANDVVPGIQVGRFHGKDRDDAYDRWSSTGGILLVSMHHEILASLQAKDVPSFGFLVIDEAHWVKNPDARRTREVEPLARRATRVLLMTGTPLVNHFGDMVSILSLADRNYAQQLDLQFGQRPDPARDRNKIKRALSRRYLRREQSAVLGELPPLILQDRRVELGPGEKAAYREEVGRRNFMGMRRAASVSTEGRSSAKLEALKEIVDEARDASRKVIIFSFFKDVLAAAHSAIGDRAYLIDGDVPSAEVVRREHAFRTQDGYAALVGQIDKVGLGKSYQMASVVVLMEPQLTPTQERQAIARAHRMRQTEIVVCTRLVAKGTVDEGILDLLDDKLRLINEIANASELGDLLGEKPLPRVSERELKRQLIDAERVRLGFDAE